MYIKLPETKAKYETVINTKDILCFNKIAITFKNGYHLDSCDEWNKILIDVCNRLTKVYEKLEERIYEKTNQG